MAKSKRRLVKESKSLERQVKQEVKVARRTYKKVKQTAKNESNDVVIKQLKITKADLIKKKKAHRQQRAIRRRLAKSDRKRSVRSQVRHMTRVQGESLLRDNDGLEDLATARSKIREVRSDVTLAKNLSKGAIRFGAKSTTYTVKGGYSLANRSYNFVQGRGFKRTATSKRWEVKLQKRLKAIRRRIARTRLGKAGQKAGKTFKIAGKTFRIASKPFLTIITNPLSIVSFAWLFLLLLIVSLVSSSPSPIQQDEFDLNDSWLMMSKLDRQKSTDEVDYWTNIDDVLFYMNYRYDGFVLSEDWPEKSGILSNTMSDALKDVWKQLNTDPDNLKAMKDLYTDKDSWLNLDTDDLADYEELLELSDETGRYSSYQDLENPLYPDSPEDEDDATDRTIVISSRFGYISKKEIQSYSIIQASQGQTVYAALSGEVTIDGNDMVIEDGDSRLTYHDLDEKRYKTGDTVEVGESIGKVSSSDGLKLTYEKQNDKEKWIAVNIGFYLEQVRYNQTTSVMTTLDLDGDSASKFKAIYDRIKKKKPKATVNGVSSILGNFETESGTNPKRAENDYAPQPVGASASSWDDPEWLDIGEPQLYGGKYPNIKRRGLGLGQWTDTYDGANRHTLLLLYAEEKGKKWYDLDLQIDFMLEGDNPYYREILDKILTSDESVEVLTERFLVNWEGNPGDKLLERQNNAKQIASYLQSSSGGTTGGSTTLQSSWGFPEEYSSKLKTYPSGATVSASLGGNTYPPGQCTWYVYNRLTEAGAPAINWLGNGQDWVVNLVAKGWTFSNTPVAGAVMSTRGGFDGTYLAYGHVSYVEYVNPDGSFLISECNIDGIQNQIHWAVKTNQSFYTFAIPPK